MIPSHIEMGFFMNEDEYQLYKLMTTIELAYQFSGKPNIPAIKHAFIKDYINKKNSEGKIDKKIYKYLLHKIHYKEIKLSHLWGMHYDQFSRNFKICESLTGLNDTARLKKLFEEMELAGYVTVYGITEDFEANQDEVHKIINKGLIAIHQSQIARIESDGNFPDERFISISAYGNKEQCHQIMAKLQKYGFGCIPGDFNESSATFIKVRSSCKYSFI